MRRVMPAEGVREENRALPQRWCYDKQAAERHWERLLALYRRQLHAR